MTTTPSPPTTAEAIGHRLLDWIAKVHGPDDLSPERMTSAIGAPVIYKPDGARAYGIGQRIDDRWHYTVRSLPDEDDGPPSILFSFDDQTGRFDDMSAVRDFDLDACAAALQAAGYTAELDVGPREAFNGVRFNRDGVRVSVRIRAESDANPQHLCVEALRIDAHGGTDA